MTAPDLPALTDVEIESLLDSWNAHRAANDLADAYRRLRAALTAMEQEHHDASLDELMAARVMPPEVRALVEASRDLARIVHHFATTMPELAAPLLSAMGVMDRPPLGAVESALAALDREEPK